MSFSKSSHKMNFCFKVFFWALLFVVLDIFFTEIIFPFVYCFFLFVVVPDGTSLEESKSRLMLFGFYFVLYLISSIFACIFASCRTFYLVSYKVLRWGTFVTSYGSAMYYMSKVFQIHLLFVGILYEFRFKSGVYMSKVSVGSVALNWF